MYFLHISSTQTSTHARVISFSAAIGCLICMIPSTFIGAVAKLSGKGDTIESFVNYLSILYDIFVFNFKQFFFSAVLHVLPSSLFLNQLEVCLLLFRFFYFFGI